MRQGALTRAIGTHDGVDFACLDLQVDPPERVERQAGQFDVVHFKEALADLVSRILGGDLLAGQYAANQIQTLLGTEGGDDVFRGGRNAVC